MCIRIWQENNKYFKELYLLMKKADTKLDLLEKIIVAMNSAASIDEVLNYLIDKCIEVTGATTGSIALINEDSKLIDITISRGLNESNASSTKLKIGEGVTGHVAKTGKPLLINNVDEVDYYVRVNDDLQSELAVPLYLEEKLIGVISVDSNKKNAFDDSNLDLLDTLSGIASQILHKQNLIDELKHRVENQEILLKIANILEEYAELKDIFEKSMEVIKESFHIKRGMLSLLEGTDKLKIFAGYHLSSEAIERGVYKIGEGITGKVVDSGKAIAIEDISQEKEFLNRMKIRRGKTEKNSFFAIPIKYENKTVGVLSVEKKYTDKKTFKDSKKLLLIIGTLISHRVHNYETSRQEKEILVRQNKELQAKLSGKKSDVVFIGKNSNIISLLKTVDMIADTEATALITGETGTGKEVLSKIIHQKSKRRDKPFITLNCASIPENLLESELFGYKKGAFTGAVSDKKGKFQLADTGTIFLDEIGDLSFPLQAKLLRALQEQIIEPLGGETSIKINVRVIAATNKNLEEMVSKQEFREDLFYRLNVIPLHIPSLASRKDDIPLLLNHFIRIFNKKYGKNITGMTERCRQALFTYNWPGNIRELENVIERAVILSQTTWLDLHVIHEKVSGTPINESKDLLSEILEQEIKSSKSGQIHKTIIDRVEKTLIEYALIKCNNKQTAASTMLGLHRNTLHAKIRDFDL